MSRQVMFCRWLAGAGAVAVAVAVAVAAGAGVLALTAAPTLAVAQNNPVETGRQLYMKNGCFSCHGTVGQGGERSAAPRLAPGPYPYEAFRALVRTPREAMPRFDVKHVSDDQLRAIHSYLVSINKGPAARDIPVLQGLLDR